MTTISSGISGSSNWGGMPPPRMEGRGGKPSFSSIDADGSGGLDKTELQTMLDKGPQGVQGRGSTDDLFSKLDSDGDGSVSQSELDKGMKPPGHDDSSSQNGFGGMGMDTQSFASMMAAGMGMGGMNGMGGMPPPPPDGDSGGFSLSALDNDQDGSITKTEFGLSTSGTSDSSSSSSASSSTDEAQQALFNLMDSDQSGDISKTEVSSFQDKMKALFEKMQQMGAQQFSSDTSSVSLTA
ncbi:MAG TPA: EF-hand domain-containing protein [Aquabacterium sp.]|uniref:EF-hand domain-containing protein n=1 Tax=Aquabacterium sp. TaxID=1872578 RepID=UPI002E363F19|nr:EF-hand domain-containing protein [Aquabacterium sp.]HEX5354948.1 EF-hand domain-containing protein [Aquabacterium sp.]